MGKIQKLPEHLIRLIAAGEVIERPASVAKELIENSLDAGARRIVVDIWGAGRTRLRVSDDGEGMSREDAEQALDRHATSKLHSLGDLEALTTFGFRGEALPSIAAVSRMEMTTRTEDSAQGWRIRLEGGRVLESGAAGGPIGTTIDVQDLFFNTPARSKFMKRDATERTHLIKTIQEIAIAHPAAGWEVSMDGKKVLDLASAQGLGERLADLWGLSIAENLLELDGQAGPCRVRGFVNKIPGHHATKAYQQLYVNQRPVQQRQLSHAVYQAYQEWLPVGRHPVFTLFLEIDPKLVDVNVHPAKREVRFSDERALYDFLYRSIRGLFLKAPEPAAAGSFQSSSPAASGGGSSGRFCVSYSAMDSPPATAGNDGSGVTTREAAAALLAQLPLDQMIADAPAATTRPFTTQGLRVLGVLQRLYILAEQAEGLLLIDQHAAAERVLYERLLAQGSTTDAPTQPLLTPLLWETSAARAQVVEAYLPQLRRLGFALESFGPQTFALKEWPAALPHSRQAKRFFDEVVEALEDERPTDKTRIQHEIAARAACRSAVMAGDVLAPAEIERLLRDMAACERPMTCPHGRPTHLRFSMTDLGHRFRRL